MQKYNILLQQNMELEESEIINLAVNIFQNVGIKRYIGDIEALKHEDIYFEIYKIIFPDSMINIFKISESSLTTGQKIQKIIEEISSIIKLDLYHISGEAIAQGNINHITNWLQLLEALSNSFIGNNYPGGGSAPDLEEYFDKEFMDFRYYTVIGVNNEFDKQRHGRYSEISSSTEEKESPQEETPSEDRLLPVKPDSKNLKTGFQKKGKKKVTFNVEQKRKGQENSRKKGNQAKLKRNGGLRSTVGSSYQDSITTEKKKVSKSNSGFSNKYLMYLNHNVSSDSLQKQQKKQVNYIKKMHRIVEELEKKNINDKNIEFQNWAFDINDDSRSTQKRIENENKARVHFINEKILEREQMLNSIVGEREALKQMKRIFKERKGQQQRLRMIEGEEEKREVEELLEVNFAAQMQNQILYGLAE